MSDITAWMLLLFMLGLGVAIWPIGRWGTRKGGNAAVMGFWISLTAGLAALGLLFGQGLSFQVSSLWIAGVAMGVAYSVGFCMLIMHCLKIGPAGPTITINNLALVAGVLFTWCYKHQPPTVLLVLGVLGACGALVLIGLRQPPKPGETTAISPLWIKYVLIGGAFSCLSFVCQAFAGAAYSKPANENGLTFTAVAFLSSAMFLLPVMIRRKSVGTKREVLAGMGVGIANVAGAPFGLAVIDKVGAAVFFPVTVAMPIVIMLVLGHFIYHEHLTRRAWLGCLVAVASVAVLAYANATK